MMIRKQIYLPADLDRRIKSEAKKRRTSEAAIIRERLAHECLELAAVSDSEVLEGFRKLLRAAESEAAKHPGSGWKFNREEIYEERLNRQRPR